MALLLVLELLAFNLLMVEEMSSMASFSLRFFWEMVL
jgi:hypothetical protein